MTTPTPPPPELPAENEPEFGFYSHWATTPHLFRPIKMVHGGEGECRLCGGEKGYQPHVEDESVVIASMRAEIETLRAPQPTPELPVVGEELGATGEEILAQIRSWVVEEGWRESGMDDGPDVDTYDDGYASAQAQVGAFLAAPHTENPSPVATEERRPGER